MGAFENCGDEPPTLKDVVSPIQVITTEQGCVVAVCNSQQEITRTFYRSNGTSIHMPALQRVAMFEDPGKDTL
jgi:hypothetical protein